MGHSFSKGFFTEKFAREGIDAQYLNFDVIDKYRDFGGIRIEDDLLITSDGARILGHDIIPYHAEDVEEYVASHKYE